MPESIRDDRTFEIKDDKMHVTRTMTEVWDAEEYIRETAGMEVVQEKNYKNVEMNKEVIESTQKVIDSFKPHVEAMKKIREEEVKKAKEEREAANDKDSKGQSK